MLSRRRRPIVGAPLLSSSMMTAFVLGGPIMLLPVPSLKPTPNHAGVVSVTRVNERSFVVVAATCPSRRRRFEEMHQVRVAPLQRLMVVVVVHGVVVVVVLAPSLRPSSLLADEDFCWLFL